MSRQNLRDQARLAVAKQLLWIEEHGSTRAGYILRYGSSDVAPELRYGEGGQRIYEADMAELTRRKAELDRWL